MPATPGVKGRSKKAYWDETPFDVKTILDGYAKGKKLGEGSFASVCLARHPRDGLEGALKRSTRADARETWRREKKALETVQGHPHVSGLHDAFVDELHVPVAYVLFMPLYSPLPARAEGIALTFLHEISEALSHIWKFGIVHGDVKPENVCFDQDKLVLCDFGVSTFCDQSWRQKQDMEGDARYRLGIAEATTLTPLTAFAVDQHALVVSVLELASGQPPEREQRQRIIFGPDDVLDKMKHCRALLHPSVVPALTRPKKGVDV